MTAGKTLDEAHRMAVEALSLHIEGMLENGDAIPEVAALDTLANDPAMKRAVAFLVNVDFAEKAKRFNITARKRRMEEIDQRAKKEGMTRLAYMVASSLTGAKRNRSAR